MRIREFLGSHPGLNSALGIVFAVLAGLLLLGYISRAFNGDDSGPVLRIPVASRDIEMGAVIKKSDIAAKKIPEKYMVPGSMESSRDIEGARSLRFIGKGEPFLSSSVTGGEGSNALASKIPPELRAYTLQPGRASGSAADLRPGDRVDVLSTSGDPAQTTTILHDRYVISVGDTVSMISDDSSAGVIDKITLLVTPGEVELLALAEYTGEISISLCPLGSEKKAH
ncbi:MAG: Flp pilus assembly protein CpaB [Actinobacteria bacterium]|nr:Flp pilus assembly protein CpaB [Actinomycetota bacterium]